MGEEPTRSNRLIDQVSKEFEETWDAETPVDFHDWLAKVPKQNRNHLLEELVRVDVKLRLRNQLPVDSDSYLEFDEANFGLLKNLLETIAPIGVRNEAKSEPSDDQDSEEPTLPPGTRKTDDVIRQIDNYELVRELGGGGMGQVYLARHHKFRERFYAVKLLKPNLVSEEALSRFEHEIEVAGKLEHPNIVFSYDAGRAGNEPYLVMEFIQGLDLQELVNEHGPLPIANACELIRQACKGLEYAFQKAGLTHRDIKPSNLMLTADNQVKVLDMGLARLREQSQSMGITTEGQLLGTPDYMAPEQWNESSKVTVTADIYSLACSLFTLLTGKPPFFTDEKSSITAKMSAHILDPPPDIRESCPGIPDELAQLIHRCLAKDPAERCQTPQELADALQPFSAGADLEQHKVSQTSIGAPSYVPTQSVLNQSTLVGDVNPSILRTRLKNRIWIGAISVIVILVIMLVAFSGEIWKQDSQSVDGSNRSDKEQKSLESIPTKTQMAAIRLSSDQKFIDVVNNVKTAEGQVVYEGERTRLEVLLPEKRYLMVLGITPASGDGKVACIWPLKTSATPPLIDGFIFGKRAAEQLKLDFPEGLNIGVRENTWVYSDGTGLHSFLAISSDSPLPSFDEIKQRLVSIDWPAENANPRHWTIQDGEAYQTEFDKMVHRGFDNSDTFSMQPVIDEIKKISGSQHVDGFVFNVEAHPGK